MTPLIKEVCPVCEKSITIGQIIIECSSCDRAMHYKCYKKSGPKTDTSDPYCFKCMHLARARYNPFKIDPNDNDNDNSIDDYHIKIHNILEHCTSHSTHQLNSILCNQPKEHSSFMFQNIDGNKSNFDSLAIELQNYKAKFSVIALAETNESSEASELYQLTGYNSFYQNTAPNKIKGTGVALYVNSQLSATVLGNYSFVTENLETLFVSISNGSQPVIVGVLYRPPSGDTTAALAELSDLLDLKMEKQVTYL